MIESALIRAFTAVRHGRFLSCGADSDQPAVAMLPARCGPTSCVMISASAPPTPTTAIKFFEPEGYSCPTSPISASEALLEAPTSELLGRNPTASAGRNAHRRQLPGSLHRFRQSHPAAHIRLNDLLIVVDCDQRGRLKVAPDCPVGAWPSLISR